MRCEYRLTGWKQCGNRASHVHTTVRSTKDGGTITRFERRCAEHAEAADKDIHTWTNERMENARKQWAFLEGCTQ